MKEDTTKLVKKAIRGSKSAYGELIAAYQIYLYKTAFLYVKNEADALDAVQECVTRGMIAIEKLKEPRYFKTWITRILLNCIWQDKKKTPTVSLDEYMEKTTTDYLIEEKVDLYDAIDSLNDQYKTAVILFYFQELKIKEIAQIMDIPEGSVKADLYRAKKQLRKWLTEDTHNKKEVKRHANDRFDAIPIPKELNHVVKAGIQEGIRQKKRLHRNKILLRHSAIAAALLAILCIGVLMVSDPALAAKLPVIGRIFSMVQEKVSYKGDFHDGAQIYNSDTSSQNQDQNTTHSSEPTSDKPSETPPDNALVQTSNGLTITVSEANCSSQALYLALCIENEEPFPADFIKTKNMEGYLPDHDLLYLKTNTYYDVPGLTKKERANGEAYGYSTPYYIEGVFVDDHTFTGIIRVSLDEDLMTSGHATNRDTAQTDADLVWEGRVEQLPSRFTYYLEISDIYADLLQYEDFQARDPETNEVITLQDAVQKHYTGTWNFAIDITMNKEKTQVVQVNKTNDQGIGIASVEKTAFEIKADIILPSGAQPYDYVVVICDADGKPLQSQGENAEIYSVYGRNTDTVHVYVCDYIKYMDELKGDGQKIANGALFDTEIHFNK